MKGLIIFFALFLGLAVFAVIGILAWGIPVYNSMIMEQENVNKVWSDVENVYQRRSDLIPNLVETVKGYADFEKGTLTAVIEARAKATTVNINANNMTPEMLKNFQGAQGELSSALSKLMVVIEKYPDLKANQNFMALQSQLENTENGISVERSKFNETARVYNTHIRTFPANIVAKFGNFQERPYFESDEAAKTVPKVQF